MAYNVETRHQMALASSVDGGATWRYYATLDNGTGYTTAYPTNVVRGTEMLTAWSVYRGGPAEAGGVGGGPAVAPAEIWLGRTALPSRR